jgi:hypothetical protein
MKQLFEITLKEKQIQSDQLKHERQCKFSFFVFPFNIFFFSEVFHSENDTLKQLVIRDGHDKQTINQLHLNLNSLQRQYNKLHIVKLIL